MKTSSIAATRNKLALSIMAMAIAATCILAWGKVQSYKNDLNYRTTLSQCAFMVRQYLYATDSEGYLLDGERSWRYDVTVWHTNSNQVNPPPKDDIDRFNYFHPLCTEAVEKCPNTIIYAIIYKDRELRCNTHAGIPILAAIPSIRHPVFGSMDIAAAEVERLVESGVPVWLADSHGDAWRASPGESIATVRGK